MNDPQEKACARTESLIGRAAVNRLAASHVLVAGLGGVGGHCAETLARAGVGELSLIDPDHVSRSNLNRQIVALHSTLGQAKVDVLQQRLLDINPELQIHCHPLAITPDNANTFLESPRPDHIADCIDDISAKTALASAALKADIPIIASMGAAGRLDPSRIRIARLNQTHNDGLAKALRGRLKQAGIAPCLPVVFSDEPPKSQQRDQLGTLAPLPAAFGLTIAAEILKQLIADS